MATPFDEVCSAAQRAWPELALDDEAFAAWLAAHALGAAVLAGEPLTDEGIAELGLAFACARRDPAALAAFDARYLRGLPAALAHMRLTPALVDEVVQLVRTKLLATTEHLERYAGQGRLRGLVQVMAVRTAISQLRRDTAERPTPDEDLLATPDGGDDPELAYLKARYRAEFRVAFAEAARTLSSRERNLLRLHLLDGVGLEPLAAMYRVHRATIVRWLAAARDALLAETRKGLRARLHVDAAELDSLMGLIGSRLDASVRRLLASSDGDQ
jgi:RNA polymerase sigma-70 factor (ECF subfamily)